MGKRERGIKVEHLTRLGRPCLGICTGKHCTRGGAQQVIGAAQAALYEAGLADAVTVEPTSCQDYCDDGPAMTIVPGFYPYLGLDPASTREVVLAHVRDGQPVLEKLHRRMRRRMRKAAADS